MNPISLLLQVAGDIPTKPPVEIRAIQSKPTGGMALIALITRRNPNF